MSFNKGINKIILAATFVLAFTGICSAQANWVEQFLNRYRPLNLTGPAANPAASDEPWRLMVQQGALPISVSDIVRLMLASNLDVAVNRFNPVAQQYIVNTFFLPFEPTLNIS